MTGEVEMEVLQVAGGEGDYETRKGGSGVCSRCLNKRVKRNAMSCCVCLGCTELFIRIFALFVNLGALFFVNWEYRYNTGLHSFLYFLLIFILLGILLQEIVSQKGPKKNLCLVPWQLYAYLIIAVLSCLVSGIWVQVALSNYTPQDFDDKFNGGQDSLAGATGKYHGGKVFDFGDWLFGEDISGISIETVDVQTWGEPLFPKGNAEKDCNAGDLPKWSNVQKLDIMKKKGYTSDSMPVMLHVHGGAWAAGTRSNYEIDNVKGVLYQNVAIVSCEYRLAPYGYSYVDMVADVKACFDWIVSDGASYQLNPEKILLSGISAGGNLVTLFAFQNQDDTRIKGLYNFAGPVSSEAAGGVCDLVEGKATGDEAGFSVATWVTKQTNWPMLTLIGDADELVKPKVEKKFHTDTLDSHNIQNMVVSPKCTGHEGRVIQFYSNHLVERMAAVVF